MYRNADCWQCSQGAQISYHQIEDHINQFNTVLASFTLDFNTRKYEQKNWREMRHGFFITYLVANQTPPARDIALMADIYGSSLLLNTACN